MASSGAQGHLIRTLVFRSVQQLGAIAVLAAAGGAQSPRATGAEMRTLAIGNALVGGSIAGIVARVRGVPVKKAIIAGFGGGFLSFYGKSIVSAKRIPLAPIVGGSVSAVGGSLIANVAGGDRPFSKLRIPVGPLRVTVAIDHRAVPRFSLNAYETVVFAALLARPEVRFSAARSLRTAASVFSTNAYPKEAGYSLGGAAVVSEFAPDPTATLHHEVVHVLQQRFIQDALGTAVEEGIIGRWLRRKPPQWLELGVTLPTLLWLDDALGGGRGPLRRSLEWEAERLESATR